MKSVPRGIRLNNPGNIRRGQKWQGLDASQPDREFDKFSSATYGIRALVILLRNYKKKYGLDTLRKILNRYAPPHENKTDKYIDNVAKWSGFQADAKLTLDQKTLIKILPAIIRQENGYCPYSEAEIEAGIKAAK